ncbi:hypothetical protein FRC01_009602, partial [Tulasnella sp. 417]
MAESASPPPLACYPHHRAILQLTDIPMASSETAHLQQIPLPIPPSGSSLKAGSPSDPSNNLTTGINKQLSVDAVAPINASENAKTIHDDVAGIQPSSRGEEISQKHLPQGQGDLVSNMTNSQVASAPSALLKRVSEAQETKAERKARKKREKEAKRARKEEKKARKAAEKIAQTSEKDPRKENAVNDGPVLKPDRPEAKKSRIDDGIAGSVAHLDTRMSSVCPATEKKRKYDEDDGPLSANSPLPSVSSSDRASKKMKPLLSDSVNTSTSASHNIQPSTAGTQLGLAPNPPRPDSSNLPIPHILNIDHQTSNTTRILPPGFDDLADVYGLTTGEAPEHSTPEADLYGPPVHLPQAQRGYYSTVYYPQRKPQFQVPTGKLSVEARAERYQGLSEDDIKAREKEYEKKSEDCPLVFREAFKHTARARLDKVAHLWLVPRVHNYYHTHSEGRSDLLDRIVRDLVHEFADLHPNFLKLKDASMEKDYLGSLRNLVSATSSSIKSTLENPSKVEAINKEVIKHLTGSVVASRPHDLWYSSIVDRLKEEDGGMEKDEGEPGKIRQAQLAEAQALEQGWNEAYDEVKNGKGAKHASRHRLKLQQEYRKAKFGQIGEEEQRIWEENAAEADRPVDPTTALISGLPFVNLVNRRFAELAKVPLVILVGAPDHQNPGRYLVYHDTYSPAPSHIPDFFGGPERFGEKILLPEFRRYTAQSLGAANDAVAEKGAPLPSAPEFAHNSAAPDVRTAEENTGPAANIGVTTPSGVSFIVTLAPRDWTIPSKEGNKIRIKVKDFVSQSFKKAHRKERLNFGILGSKSGQYINLSYLPRTRVIDAGEDDGKMVWKESVDSRVVYLSDPTTMPWYEVKAYFDLLKDPNSKFAWRVEESSTSGNLVNPPASVQQSLRASEIADSVEKPKGRKKSKSGPAVVASDSSSARGRQPLAPSQRSKPGTKRKQEQKSQSEDEAVFSDGSSDSSDYSVGSESSADEGYRPSTEYFLRPETISRKGRRSAPPTTSALKDHYELELADASPSVQADRQGENADETRTQPEGTPEPAPSVQTPNLPASKTASLLISPEKRSIQPTRRHPVDNKRLYSLKPTTEPQSSHIPASLSTVLECLRTLLIPKSLSADKPPLPDLQVVIQHCVRLDCIFNPREPMLPSLPGLDASGDLAEDRSRLFWDNLNNPLEAIPTRLTAEKVAANIGTTVETLVGEVFDTSLALVEVLEGHDMLEDGEKGSFRFVSWTSYLLLLARYLQFIESIESIDGENWREDLVLLHERVLELAVIHVILRYCVGSTLSHIQGLPAPSESLSPSMANAIPTLALCWVRMLSVSGVWGPNWALVVDPSVEPGQADPFFFLNEPDHQWITVDPTHAVYNGILEMEKTLHSKPNALEELPTYTQITFLTSMFAVHINDSIRGSDEAWLGVVDKVVEVLESSRGGGGWHEMERNPKQPPPTLVASMQPEPAVPTRPRPRPSSLSSKSSWSVGDIARTTIYGVERDVTFAYKQKEDRCRYLVMADPETRKEIFASDGETELPLPPFSPSSLVKRGSRNPVEVALLRVHGYWDLPNFKIGDLQRPELAGFFAQLSNLPEEDVNLSTLEKAGFRPPSFFTQRYAQDLAAAATMSGPEEMTTTATSSPLVASTTTLPTPAPIGDSPPLVLSAENVNEKVDQDPVGVEANDVGGAGESGEVVPQGDGPKEDNNDEFGGEKEESEEEEVENVLGSELGPSSEAAPKRQAKKVTKEKKANIQKGKERAVVAKANSKPKEPGLSKRSSARLQGLGPAGTPTNPGSAPAATKRSSQRNKQ